MKNKFLSVGFDSDIQHSCVRKRSFYANYFTILFCLGLFLTPSVSAQISGTVFRDFNANGIKDNSASLNEFFEQGVTIKAYNALGIEVGSTSSASNGSYSFTGLTLPLRIEFSNFSTGDFAAAFGAGSASSVQFYSATTTTANFGVSYPRDYCGSTNPTLITSCYVSGDQVGGVSQNDPVLISFPYNAGSRNVQVYTSAANTDVLSTIYDTPTSHTIGVAAKYVGTTFGLAYARTTQRLYAGTFFKKHAGFGAGADGVLNNADDPSALYVINASMGTVVNTFTIPNASTNAHNTADYTRDNDNIAWNAVGKTSLGGVDISDDEQTLYVMNLENRRLYALNATTGAVIASVSVENLFPTGCATCNQSEDVRPFAVEFYKGKVYIGIIYSAETADNRSDLRAYIYTADPTTLALSTTPVFQFSLDYPRGKAAGTGPADWRAWKNTFTNISTALATRVVYPMPMFTSITFDNGNLIIGLRDRLGDIVGNQSKDNPDAADPNYNNLYQARTAGDLLRASGSPATGWTIESQGRSNGNGTAIQNTGQGVGGAEFYHADAYPASATATTTTPYTVNGISYNITAGTSTVTTGNIGDTQGFGVNHDELSLGTSTQISGFPDVVAVVFDPTLDNGPEGFHDGGIRWMSNTTGQWAQAYRIYNGDGTATVNLGKANGLGELVPLCAAIPLEIGNRIWNDTNKNGVQDAGETGINGVIVKLFEGATEVGSVTTSSNGQYYFTNSNVTGGVKYNTNYQIRIASAQGSLTALVLTTTDASGSDLIDNDGTTSGANAIKTFTTGNAGENNHSYDFGFKPEPCNVSVTTNLSDCYDSNGNATGGTSVVTVQALVSWSNLPANGILNVTCTGAPTQQIYTGGLTSPAVVRFEVPSTGQSVTVTATGPDCMDSKIITAPLSNCVLTPCCAFTLGAPQTFTNTDKEALLVQTDCNTTLTKTFNVTGLTGTVNDVNLGLLLTHTYRGDLRIQLTSPTGTIVTLVNQSTDNNDNYDMLLDDSAFGKLNNVLNQDTLAPNFAADRTVRPANLMAAFNGQNPNGTWTLTFCNTNFSTSGGRLLTFKEANLELITKTNGTCTNNTGGTVWRDYNADGTKNTAETEGLKGVTVKAYDCNGNLVETATTDYLGQYRFTTLTPSVANPIRLEFSNITAPYKTSNQGANNGTDVQFITSPDCNYNLGINDSNDYCENNPLISVPCYTSGNTNADVLVTFPYSYANDLDGNIARSTTVFPSREAADNLGGFYEATLGQIGAVYGVAWDKFNKRLFTSAYMKRKVPFGVLSNESTGAIYLHNDPATTANTPSVFVDLNTIFLGSTGVNPHPIATTDWFADSTTLNSVGKLGLGDLDISRDGKKLYSVNLFNREIFEIPTDVTPNASNINRIAIPTTGLPIATDPSQTCPVTDVRPFGLGVDKNGVLHVGAVCSGETTFKDSDLTLYIWKYDGSSFQLELTQAMNYRASKGFRYWKNPTDLQMEDLNGGMGYNDFTSHPMPMVGDIEFDVDGSMIIGIKDRLGDLTPQSYNINGFPYSRTNGDIIRVCNMSGTYVMEYGGKCNNTLTSGTSTFNDATGGHGGYEFYYGDTPGDSDKESAQGALLLIPGKGEVVGTAYDAVYLNGSGVKLNNNYGTGGIQKYSNTTGATTGAYDVYLGNDVNTFGKAGGLGDIEALCGIAPIEIGNFAWIDTDGDGVQDPCETPLSNLTVKLYKMDGGTTSLVATTTTGPKGNYYFKDFNEFGAGYDTLMAGKMYFVVIEDPTFDKVTGKLTNGGSTYTLAVKDATTNNGNDQNDSDAFIVTGGKTFDGYPANTVTIPTDAAGYVNHTLDFGFKLTCDTALTVSNTTTCNGTAVNLFTQVSGVKGTLTYSTNGTAWTALTNPTNVTPSVLTTYFIKDTLTNGCVDIDTLTITVSPVPTGGTVQVTKATCTNGVANTNGTIAITGITNGTKYSYGTGGTTGLFALNATTLSGSAINISSLGSPLMSTTYTFRIYGADTTCYQDITAVLDPSVCPICSITATFTQGSCNNNGTTVITTDDYFTVTVTGVSSTNGGTSGKYEVILNGNALNIGGTAYGTPVTVGGILDFKSNGSTTYNLTVRDFDMPTCVTTVFTTTASAACSTVGCKPVICMPVTVTKF